MQMKHETLPQSIHDRCSSQGAHELTALLYESLSVLLTVISHSIKTTDS